MNQSLQETGEMFLNAVTDQLSVTDIFTSLAAALVLASVMWIVYRFVNTAAAYRPKFAVTLVMLAFISTILMDLIQSNLALSLGMLGSLSIVRFRTNISDPRDIGFIFWSMAIGVAAATQSYLIGGIGSAILAAVIVCTRKRSFSHTPMLLVIRGSRTDLEQIQTIVNRIPQNAVKAKNILADSFELVYEVQIAENQSNQVIENIFELGGIDSVNLLAGNVQNA